MELKKMELTSASGSELNLEALYQIMPSAFTEVRDDKKGEITHKINTTAPMISRTVAEMLYSAMEDYSLDIIVGQGPSARSIRLDLPKFTLVGATTRAGMLTAPLRDRFGVVQRLEFYTEKELQTIRAGRANPHVLDKIRVDYYGSPYLPKNYATLHTVPAKSMEY